MAILATVKTTERLLESPVVLPKAELTLAEMDQETNFECAQWLPRYIYVATTSENSNRRIQFRTTDIALREFIDTIESPLDLRHRFRYWSNGSSILFGGDCCIGLRLR